MDFLEIRRKAKERAAARAAEVQARAGRAGPPPAARSQMSPDPNASPGAPGRAAPDAPPAAEPEGRAVVEPTPDQAAWLEADRALLTLDPIRWPVDPPAPAAEAGRRAEPAPGADRFAGYHPSVSGPVAPAVSEEDAEAAARLEAELEAKLAGMPSAPDARFRTWRPSGAVPAIAPMAPAPEDGEEADEATGRRGRGVEGREGDGPPGRAERGSRAGRGQRGRDEPRAEGPPGDPLDDFFFEEGEGAAGLEGLPVAASVPHAEAPVALEEYLTFLLGAEAYGVAIGRVREVMRSPPVTEVPRAPPDVMGVITVRGEVVAVFDPRRRLGLPPDRSGDAARVVIVEDGGGPFGLLVDSVSSVVRLPAGAVEPCPQGLGGASADCLSGVGRDHDRLFTVLDVSALLKPIRRAGEGRP
jgi:purine-binding chemotaxis protein CheW